MLEIASTVKLEELQEKNGTQNTLAYFEEYASALNWTEAQRVIICAWACEGQLSRSCSAYSLNRERVILKSNLPCDISSAWQRKFTSTN